MKTIILLILTLMSSLVLCQIPNASFEVWENQSNWEVPVSWSTNNDDGFISISKAPALVNGDYAMKVKSGGASFEGFAPGIAKIRFLPDVTFNTLQLHYFVDSLLTQGSIEVIVSQFDNGIFKKIAEWRSNELSTETKELMLPLDVINQDSVEVLIIANTLLTTLGYEGYSSVIVDDIDVTLSASLDEQAKNEILRIYPNPSKGHIIVPNCIDCNYKLYDTNGKMIKQGNLASEKLEIEDAGVYILQVNGMNFSGTESLVVIE